MARRKRHEEHVNHEAWAIPYGDLVTLLMAFFVVMYAVSVVDAGKYSVLSESLIEAFGTSAPIDPIQIGDPILESNPVSDDVRRSLAPVEVIAGSPAIETTEPDLEPFSPTDVALAALIGSASEEERGRILGEIREMSTELEEAMGSLIEAGNIEIKRQPYWIEVAINSNLLFSSGSATLEPAARPVLARVARLLGRRDVRIHVEGHTDNLPINNTIYPSNWELSSGRAATVVNLFAQNGIDPERMVAIGYGQFQPTDSNATEAGRARNRRVAVIVLPDVRQARSGERTEPERLKSDFEVEPGPGIGVIQ
ncbi:flagellar motor protein MotD [Allochromatium vinosum]|uniref:OmpA/MotB domain protein n=1 Tax=Allochromatium vinosum (strain ATCC 17899 / DSM 180 / NBRC 103801 / NCIMB 10441 / D) TaxID=572477 RepID=D3RRA8_ALLVD|nr:flagellar motor protein MotD [Allochromatium vinosum]ADC63820.1 OmpA/MotB domain protein [Allochromatium vinosum DSM 180]MBK1653780.1 flagellar motor protein MotD [Allochromatium vinosum]